MNHSSFSTSKRKARFALAVLVLLAGLSAALILRSGLGLPPLVYALALGGVFLVLAVVVVQKFGRPRDDTRIEPTFETSILAFPPEPKFERRPLRPQ